MAKKLFILGALLAIYGVPVALVGLLAGLFTGFWWLAWGGLLMVGTGLLGWVAGVFGTARKAHGDAAAAVTSCREP